MKGTIFLGLTVLSLGFFLGYGLVICFAKDPYEQEVPVQLLEFPQFEQREY